MSRIAIIGLLCVLSVLPLAAADDCEEPVVARISIDPGHGWRPPFGLDRVGQPATALVEISSENPPVREYSLVGYLNGREFDRYRLRLSHGKSPYTDRVPFAVYPTELVLYAKCLFMGKSVEVARVQVTPPSFEAEAVARPDEVVNPVDLGAILVPHDWLLLGPGQKGEVEVAALTRAGDIPGARITAWFESMPKEKASTEIKLTQGIRVQVKLPLPVIMPTVDHDRLRVILSDAGGKVVWEKQIETMFVRKAPRWPQFGAAETKLRYDMPIQTRDRKTGASSTIPYDKGWSNELNDVVVSFPNGARFVFWRGDSYAPFWAGRYNTGLCYEWAETSPPPEGFQDSVEPLMDKELRYGRVKVLESTPSRVHVRWSYQSCDYDYKVFGDLAQEDFYFYPDGFGTRVLALKSAPGAEYELSELIILSPPQAYPFDVLPKKTVDLLFLDGWKREVDFPYVGPEGKYTWPDFMFEKARTTPVVYRVWINKNEQMAGIYFNPQDLHLAPHIYKPFYDRGYQVTPEYWGNHWPLTRGRPTGWVIDDSVSANPGSNSLITWGLRTRPAPLDVMNFETIDALGRSKPMTLQRWAWLIGMTDASDQRLLDWARSYSRPPSLEVVGGGVEFDGYVPERRAFRLRAESDLVSVKIKPAVRCVNPVFEFLGAPKNLENVSLGGRRLSPNEYAWDGEVLWLNADIDQPEELRLEFGRTTR